jgi:hypothetical protein
MPGCIASFGLQCHGFAARSLKGRRRKMIPW